MAAIKTLTLSGPFALLRRESDTIYVVVDSGELNIDEGTHVLINASVTRQEARVDGERLEIFPASAVIGSIEYEEEE